MQSHGENSKEVYFLLEALFTILHTFSFSGHPIVSIKKGVIGYAGEVTKGISKD